MSGLLILSIGSGIAMACVLVSLLWTYREWHIVGLAGLLAWLVVDAIGAALPDRLGAATPEQVIDLELKALALTLSLLVALLLLAHLLHRRARRGEPAGAPPAQVQRLIDALPALVGYVSADRRYHLVNRRMADYLGRSPDRVVGLDPKAVFVDEAGKALWPHIDAALAGQHRRFRARLRYPDLGLRSMEVAYAPERDSGGRVTGYFILAHDVSEAERAERALSASEQRFRDLTDIASDWFWETDQEGRYVYVSPRMQETTGMPTTAMLGARLRDLPEVEASESAWRTIEEAQAARRPFRNVVYRLRRPGRQPRVLQISGKPHYDRDRAFQGYRGVCSDITEGETLVERRAQAELRYVSAIESLPEAFALYDRDDRLVSRNHVHRVIYEAAAAGSEAVGRSFEEIMRAFAGEGGVAGDRQAAEAWIEERLARRERPARHMRFETVDGHWLEVTDFLLSDDSMITITADVTARERAESERRERETEVAQVQRRSVMGEMAAMLAHELNQPLCAVANYAGGCLSRMRRGSIDPSDTVMALERIRDETGRASDMLRGIGAFLGGSEVEAGAVEVAELIATVELLVRPELQASGVRAVFSVAPELPTLEASRIEIEQVLLNLVRNAIEALQEVPGPERRLTLSAQPSPPDRLAIEISDNGKGIPPEVGSSAFNPFFTTKGDGLGMGLTISRRIARIHGGDLRIVSTEPGATTFRLTLPFESRRRGDGLRAA